MGYLQGQPKQYNSNYGGTLVTHVDLNDKISGGDTDFGWDGHGIHVSGIAAAESNNSQGVSGVDWNARIHPRRVDNVDDAATYQAIVDAVNYSANVHVLNNSWGLTDGDGNPGRYSTTVHQAFAYAYKADRTCVVSMGNHQVTHPGVVSYPAGFWNVISVGATNNEDIIARFSAQGNHIDVCAPGVGILSTVNGGGYGNMSGTSMAAPFVSGIASLLKGFGPNLANDDIENIIKLSADDQWIAGFDTVYGYGRVNAERALNFLRAPYSLSQWTTTSGSPVGSTGQYKIVFMGTPGLASSVYLVKRYEVRKTITFPKNFLHIDGVWGRGAFTIGWSPANPNFGEGFCEVVPGTQTNSGVTLRTYVYEVWSITGSYYGYYPKTPANVNFAYTVLGVSAPTLSGPATICSAATFTVKDLPSGCSIIWSHSSNLTQSSVQGSNPCTFSPNGTGNGWVKATIKSSWDALTLSKVNIIGSPTPSISSKLISGTGEPTEYRFTATAYSGASYSWYLNGIVQQGETGNTFDWYFPCGVTKTVKCKLSNSCGTSAFSNSSTRTGGCDRTSYSVSPNPVSSNVTISTTSDRAADSTELSYSSFDFVRVFDFHGNLKKFINYPGANSASINVADLQGGIYIFEIGNTEYTEKHQVIIEK